MIFCLLFLIISLGCFHKNKNCFNYSGDLNDSLKMSFFPAIGAIDTGDLIILWDVTKYLKAFDEKPFYTQPLKSETYRLTYLEAFREPILLTLNQNSIIIKKGNKDRVDNSYHDLTKLTGRNYDAYDTYIRNTFVSLKTFKREWFDESIKIKSLKKFPLLKFQGYIDSLEKITEVPDSIPFTYTTNMRQVPRTFFNNFIKKLNNIGFWEMKSIRRKELLPFTDETICILEGNTKHNYQFILFPVQGEAQLQYVIHELLQYVQ
jgi:hypothetical protein